MKNKSKRTRNCNPLEACTIEGCNSIHYAKGYCRNHWGLFNRNGFPGYKSTIIKTCSVEGCNKKITALSRCGMCTFHNERIRVGIDVNRPKGNSGELNHMWKGGVAQYPNHYEMKLNRRIVLEKANNICHYCGDHANEIHHVDGSKDNHSIDNMVACCHSCNMKRGTSKFIRMYGLKTVEIAEFLECSLPTVSRLYKNGVLSGRLIEKYICAG